MMKKILITVFASLLLGNVFGQKKATVFPETRPEFIKALKEYFSKSNNKDLLKSFNEFERSFNGGVITEDDFPVLRSACNEMLKLKMTANPYFRNYLSVVLAAKKNTDNVKAFSDWNNLTVEMLKGIKNRKLRPYKDYLNFSQGFFEHNALHYSPKGMKWFYASDKYQMSMKDGMPIVEFEELDLVGSRGKDSIAILETSGIYFPTKLMWKGIGGKVTWERLEQPEVYCTLSDYQLETKKSIYEAKNVKLSYPEMFPGQEILGDLGDKVVVKNKATEGSYPRFISQKKILKIDNIGSGIKYVGGFKLHGKTVYGFGTKEQPAKIEVSNNGKVAFRGAAQQFVIRKDERLGGEQVEVSLYFDADSIYHPSINLKYLLEDKALSLSRGDRGSDRNPFFNSFHQVNMKVDRIDWNLEESDLIIGPKKFGMGSSDNEVEFESLKYFDEGYARRVQNISSKHPIIEMKLLADELDTKEIEARGYALRLNKRFDVQNIETLLYELVANGFINYDKDDEIIYVKDKIFHYADAMSQKTDYDAIKIVSASAKDVNAVLSMDSKELVANDVQNLELSAKQKVAIKPAGSALTMKKNRDMDFSGKVFAGYSTLEGVGFHFEYDKYLLTLDSVRYFDLFVPSDAKDEKGNKIAHSMASRIEHAKGVLLVESPENKSGNSEIDIFPSFNTKGPSYVYYDDMTIHDGVYKRDSFYFELDKFSFNSLDDYTKDDIHFKGKLISSEVFPDFKETLLLQDEDQSLGFTTQTPGAGYPTYQGKGTYKGEIHLSNKGMLGNGNISYLTSSTDSEDLVFKPKQMTGTARIFDLQEDRTSAVKVPQAHGEEISINWLPYRDSMYVIAKEKPFDLFKANEHTLKGSLVLTPFGLKGKGLLSWTKGSLQSKLMSFGAYSATADTSSLKINAVGGSSLALNTFNVNSNLDFDKQLGHVEANTNQQYTHLPFNKYKTSMTTFDWDMKNDAVTFITDGNEYGTFIATGENQDSLNFQGKTAFYDLKSNKIKVGGVPFINTCDATVYTETGDVEILQAGKIPTLNNCKIICDTINKHHVINKATVTISGRKEYRANGFYEYHLPGREQEIKFDNIVGTRVGKGKRSEKGTLTAAEGSVDEKANFYIDAKTKYRGEIKLKANKKELDFKGYARLDAPRLRDAQWFSINSEGDKKDLTIQYDVPKNYDGTKLYTGLYLSKEAASVYPRVMMPKYFTKDRILLEAKGLFKYVDEKDEFIFGDSLKVVADVKKGNKVTFKNKDGAFEAEGKFNLCEFIKHIDVQATGVAKTVFPAPQDSTIQGPYGYKVEADFMAGITMPIPEKMLNFIIQDIKSSSFDAKSVNFSEDELFYEKALSEYINDTKLLHNTITKMKTEFKLGIPKKVNPYTFLFAKMPMKWDTDYQSFISKTPTLGLISINGEEVNIQTKAAIEFKMPSNKDDRLYIYIKSPSDSYYFFGYIKGVLSIVSNNPKFNDLIINMKKKERILKMDDGESFEFQYVEPSTAERWLRRVQATQ